MKIVKKLHPDNSISPTDNNRLMLKMVTSYSVFLLVILILGVYLYFSTNENVRNQFLQQNKAMLHSSIRSVDKDLDIMEVFCRQLLQDNTFKRLASRADSRDLYFLSDGFNMKNDLSANMYPENLLPINEYYIHLEKTDYLISSNHFVGQALFYSGTRRYPESKYNTWVDYLEKEEYHNTLISLDDFTLAPNVHYYMYVIGLDGLTSRSIEASACFVIDAVQFGELFSGIEFYEDGYMIITDEQGSLLYGKSGLEDPYDTSLLDTSILENLSYTQDFSHTVLNGEQMLVIRQTSEANGWNYYLALPARAYKQTFHSSQQLLLVFLSMAFVIGVWLVFVFSRRNVRPIVRLGKELHEAVETTNQLQEVVDKQKPIIRNSYVRQLMLGTVASGDEMEYIQDYLGMREDLYSFNVLYAVVYESQEEASQASLPDEDELFPIVLEAMKQYLGEPLMRYSPSDRTYAVLLSCPKAEEDSFLMKMQDCVFRLHEYLLDHHAIWFFAGIGRTTDSLINVWEAYQQAQEAINYASKNYFFLPYEFIKKDSNVFYYPPELSTKLIHFITSGNKPQVLELFNLIHQENIEERSLPVSLLKYLLSDIRNTLLKARFTAPAGTDKSVLETLDAKFDKYLSFRLCEDIAISLCDIFQVEQEDTSLAATIEKYIKEHYRDPSMCLNKISDEFQISESYFSHMFKEKTGVNFSVYLENIRMKEAARLVRDTDANLSSLYLEVGYNNINTFRRAFKKTYGITPSSMRETAALGKAQ